MKLNWGTKIAIFYSSFVAFTLFMVYMAFGQKYDLVTEDYYAQEIKYQGTINSKIRAEALESKVKTTIEKSNLRVIFPQKEVMLLGNINCFRPSDEEKDFTVNFNTDKGFYDIPLNQFEKGKYLFKISWVADSLSFYKEQTVIIP